MAYGFKLGQIEGLDSSVETVTLTIANATESNTYTLNKVMEDPLIWADGADSHTSSVTMKLLTDGIAGLNVVAFTESDVGDTYNVTLSTSAVEENFKSAVETVLADNGLINVPETLFDGTITITDGVVEIPFDIDVSGYPFKDWTVEANNVPLSYNGNYFTAQNGNLTYVVGSHDGTFEFGAYEGEYEWVPGDYQVKITAVSKSETDSDNTIYIDASNGGVATMSVDPTILYDAVNTGEAIPRVVVRTGGGAHEICDMVIPDRPHNTIALTLYTFGYNSIEGGSVSNEFYFNIDVYSFTKGNKTSTREETKGTIPFTSQS